MCIDTSVKCTGRAFKQNDSKICVATCHDNNSYSVPEWGDNTTGYCVATCHGTTFGDLQHNM